MTEIVQIAHHDVWERCHGREADDARRDLVDIYARIVKYVAGRMAIGLPHYVEFNDLISAGSAGPDPGHRQVRPPTAASSSRPTPSRASAARSWTSCAARTGSRARCAARPSSWRRPTRASRPGWAGRPPTPRWPATWASTVEELDGLLGEVSIATIMSLDADTGGDESENTTSLGDYLADPATEDVEQVLARAGDEGADRQPHVRAARRRSSWCWCSTTTRS